jgi:hypothetical protein
VVKESDSKSDGFARTGSNPVVVAISFTFGWPLYGFACFSAPQRIEERCLINEVANRWRVAGFGAVMSRLCKGKISTLTGQIQIIPNYAKRQHEETGSNHRYLRNDQGVDHQSGDG